MLRFLIVYLIIVCTDLTIIWWDMPYRWLSKPLIMLVLIGWYIYERRYQWAQRDTVICIAVAAAWLGDVLLLNEGYFLFGLGSFLVMQLLYTVLFLQFRSDNWLPQVPYAFLLMAVILMVLRPMWSDLGALQWPVVVYTLAIGVMAWTGALRQQQIPGYWAIVMGTILFMVSDSALALDRFADIEVGKLTVMSTYAAAQYLIVQGFLDQQNHLERS